MKLFIKNIAIVIFLFFNHSSLSLFEDPLSATFKPSPKDSKAYGFSSRKPSSAPRETHNFKASFALLMDGQTKEAECIQALNEGSSHLAPSLIGVKSPSRVAQKIDWKLPFCDNQAKARLASLAPKMVKASPEEVAVVGLTKLGVGVASCTGLVLFGEESFKQGSLNNDSSGYGATLAGIFAVMGLQKMTTEKDYSRKFKTESDSLSSEIKKTQSSLDELQGRQNEISAESKALHDSIAENTNKIQNHQRSLRLYENIPVEVRANLVEEIKELKASTNSLSHQLTIYETRKTTLSTALDQINTEINDTKTHLSELGKQQQNFPKRGRRSGNSASQIERMNLNKEAKLANTNLNALQSRQGQLLTEQSSLDVLINDNKTKLTNNKQRLSLYETIPEGIRHRLPQEIGRLEADIGRANHQMESNRTAIANLNQEFNKLEGKIGMQKGLLSVIQENQQRALKDIDYAKTGIKQGATVMAAPTVLCTTAGGAVAYFDIDIKAEVMKKWDEFKQWMDSKSNQGGVFQELK